MDKPDTILEIQTLGRFGICINGKPLTVDWPDETLKLLFCSLLSPLDLYFTWDRLCRSMWDVPITLSTRHLLNEKLIRPLGSFLMAELGFNPLCTTPEGIHIDQQSINVDAREFYSLVLEGLRLSSLDDHCAALEKYNKANLIYNGSYLPGFPGKIIENARHDLEALHRVAVIEATPLARNTKH